MKRVYNPIIELLFEFATSISDDNIENIFIKLMKSDLDENTLGFYVWDIQENKEIYSPKFRATLQFTSELDFPNVPESWMGAIEIKDKEKSLANFEKHVKSKGKYPYSQEVRYHKKYKGYIDLVCYGKVVSWVDDKPKIMVGFHQSLGYYNKE